MRRWSKIKRLRYPQFEDRRANRYKSMKRSNYFASSRWAEARGGMGGRWYASFVMRWCCHAVAAVCKCLCLCLCKCMCGAECGMRRCCYITGGDDHLFEVGR